MSWPKYCLLYTILCQLLFFRTTGQVPFSIQRIKLFFFFFPSTSLILFKTGVLWSGSEVWNHRSCLRKAGLVSLTEAHHTFTMGLQPLCVHADIVELQITKKYLLSPWFSWVFLASRYSSSPAPWFHKSFGCSSASL